MNSFYEIGYVPVKEIVSEEMSNIFTQYALIEELSNFQVEYGTDKENAVKNTQSRYADSLTESILLKIKPTIEYITELELLPTYSYYRVYRPGGYLLKHTDRKSCEISVSICFGYNYMQESENLSWPLMFEDVPILLKPRDGVVYRGCDVMHGREKFESPEGSYHVQGFFHYVDKNGPNRNYALDSRSFIGQKKPTNPYKKSYLSPIWN